MYFVVAVASAALCLILYALSLFLPLIQPHCPWHIYFSLYSYPTVSCPFYLPKEVASTCSPSRWLVQFHNASLCWIFHFLQVCCLGTKELAAASSTLFHQVKHSGQCFLRQNNLGGQWSETHSSEGILILCLPLVNSWRVTF